MHDPRLIIFCKQLIQGRVKTRIAQSAGKEKALNIYKELCEITLINTRAVFLDRIIYFDSEPAIRNEIWIDSDLRFNTQVNSDLGERMLSAFQSEYHPDHPDRPLLLIGTDCPEITLDLLQETVTLLNENDVALGPTYDGGYYLIALKKPLPRLFLDMQWSTENVLQDTIERCQEHNFSYALLDTLHDIDYEQDWIDYKKRNGPE